MKRLMTLMALLALAGCMARDNPNSNFGVYTKQDYSAEEIKNDLLYFKDDYGNCYASIGSMGSHGFVNVAITTIPCERMPQ